MSAPLLRVRDLAVDFQTHGGRVQAVRGLSLDLAEGETLALVGESGCGKSVAVQALLGLIPMPPGRIAGGEAWLKGRSLLTMSAREASRVRGAEVGMIFQDPMTSLNPTMTIGAQIAETLVVHEGRRRREAHAEAVALLEKTQIPEPRLRARQYPFELSGGMLQRAMIAQSIACKPALLIADEPTTALDVTIQAQILALLKELAREARMAILLITHDLAVVAQMAQRVAVMYAGQIVEAGAVDDLFYRTSHPYTLGLKRALPSARPGAKAPLQPIPGSPPDLFQPPPGCGYCPRCPHAMQVCRTQAPPLLDLAGGMQSRCWLHHPGAPGVPGLHQPGSHAA